MNTPGKPPAAGEKRVLDRSIVSNAATDDKATAATATSTTNNTTTNTTTPTTSVVIPASPLMKKLGWGTGVSVYCFSRTKKDSVVNSTGSMDGRTSCESPKTPSMKRFKQQRFDALLRSPASTGRFAGNASFSNSPWAIKKVNKKAPPIVVERLKEEAQLLRTLQHPNIVGFRQVRLVGWLLLFLLLYLLLLLLLWLILIWWL